MVIETSLSLLGVLGLTLWWRSKRVRVVEQQECTIALDSSALPEAPSSPPASSAEAGSRGPGDRIGAYKLEEYLGEGGMARVYRATSADKGGRVFALKLIREELAKDEQFQKRFRREIKVCQDLKHPNIVALEDWGEEDGCLYLVLEYVEGQVLSEQFSPQVAHELGEVLPYLEGLIGGLSYAHERGVVHRDLKPDNVMISRHGEVKIMDFGLARGAGGDKVTKTGNSMGTPAYVPPEQITGAEPSPAVDQYSLGVILYELLTGHRPFQEKNPLKLLMQHLSEAPPDPMRLKPELHPTCAAILLRMLEKSPADRFPSLHWVKEGLLAVEKGEAWELPKRARSAEEVKVSNVEISLPDGASPDDETMGFEVSS